MHNDFFEEIAKFRAARRIWARLMKERFGAKNPRSWLLRTHAQTAGVSLMAQQPMNNVVRTTLQALAAVLGGTQSLHTNSFDETYALPTEEAATLALRTQQVIAEESGVTQVADPLGGSYFVERLTDQMEEAAMAYIDKIDELGGIVRAVEDGYPQREIANSAYQFQRQVDTRQRAIVGVNKYVTGSEGDKIPTAQDRLRGRALAGRSASRSSRRRATARRRRAPSTRSSAPQRATPTWSRPCSTRSRRTSPSARCQDVFRQVWGEHRDPAYL